MTQVKNGKRIALEEGLPEVVVDFIPQHHTRVAYHGSRGQKMRAQNRKLKTMNKPPASIFRHIKALLITIFCFQVMLGCGPSPCPTKEIAERMARQLINKEYSDEMYNIDLETKRIFMKQIEKEKYCVYEFNYNATLKPYYLRYEKLERPGYKKGLQIAYLQREEGWYGTIIQKAEQHSRGE